MRRRRYLRVAIEMHQSFVTISTPWKKRGRDLNLRIGIAKGYATLGRIGFEGRSDYGAIGKVTNLSARLCGEAKAGQTLVAQSVHAEIEALVDAEPVEVTLKGIGTISAFNVTGMRG